LAVSVVFGFDIRMFGAGVMELALDLYFVFLLYHLIYPLTKAPKYAILYHRKMQVNGVFYDRKDQNMSIFKPNLKKTIKTKALILAILASVVCTLVTPTTVKAQEEDSSIFSVIRAIFSTSTGDNTDANAFPVAEARIPRKTVWVTVTAYSSTVDQCDSTPCITANGFDLCSSFEERAVADTIAANFLKFGTHVRLPDAFGEQTFVVRDRMNSKYNGQNRIDVWMPTRELARNFGVKRVKMEIF